MSMQLKFGLTENFQCNYLPEQQERLLICAEPENELAELNNMLIKYGFRRSGSQIYRPHCESCQACESLRIISTEFTPSRSQKRVLQKNKDLQIIVSEQNKSIYYPLFEQYINQLHADGSMYPASQAQYSGFIQSNFQESKFVEAWLGDTLLAVAVTDLIDDGYSALYTFYSPNEAQRSLGTWMILQQIFLCQQDNKKYLYLGYQIDECKKMNYKANFYPHERYRHNNWFLYRK